MHTVQLISDQYGPVPTAADGFVQLILRVRCFSGQSRPHTVGGILS